MTVDRHTPRPHRILFNGSLASSVVAFRGDLIADLVARGYEVHASSPELVGDAADAARALGATPHDVPLRRAGFGVLGDIDYARAIHRLVRTIRADLVIGYTIKPNIWGSIAAALGGAQSVAMVTGLGYSFIPGKGLKRRVVQAIARTLYRLSTSRNSHVVFQNPDDCRDFIAAGCLSKRPTIVMVNGSGVDLVRYSPAPLPPAPVFLLIARLLHTKGISEYVAASAIVRASLPDARFLLVGPIDDGPDGYARTEVDSWAAKGIDYRGPMNDVRSAITEASVYVLPSYREGTPRSVLEAMAMGRPVITTNAPGCRETVIDGDNGRLVRVGDSAALAEAMLALGSDAALRDAMGRRSRALAETKYAVERVNADLIGQLGLAAPRAG